MAAGLFDLAIEQGVTFRLRVSAASGTPPVALNLTGYTARLQVRPTATSTAAPLISLNSGTAPPASGLTLGGAAGTIDVLIAAADTDAVTATKAVYDLELYAPNGDVVRLLKGNVLIDAEVTR